MPTGSSGETALESAYRFACERPVSMLEELDACAAEEHLIDFVRFVWPMIEPSRTLIEGWVLHAVCEHLEAVTRGEIRKLLINIPPGCTKSMTTNVLWPAWEWGPLNLGHLRVISAAHTEANTMRDNVRCRDVIRSPLYQRHWGHRFQLKEDQNAKGYFENTRTGWRFAGSVRGGITGKRGDRIIIDDPHDVRSVESDDVREEAVRWFSEVLPTRTNSKDTAFVVIMQRVHETDLSGFILSKELGYEHLCLPMRNEPGHPHPSKTSLHFVDPRGDDAGALLWPELYPEERVAEEELQMRAWGGDYAVAGQHQQRPSPRVGGMFQRSDFGYVDQAQRTAARRVRAWDFAGSKNPGAKFTAGVRMALDGERVVVEDVVRLRGGPHEVDELIVTTATADGRGIPISIPIDPGQAGIHQVAHLQAKLAGYDVRFSPETGSKVDRARPFSSVARAGNLSLVRAAWNDAYVAELIGFPSGHYSDQVDASSRGYKTVLETPAETVGESPRLYTRE